MEKTIEDIPKIQNALHTLRQDLNKLDQRWENAAKSKIFSDIQIASRQANIQIQNLHGTLSGLVLQFESEADPDSLEVIRRRGQWLHAELVVIDLHLKHAAVQVTSAISFTNDHTYQVMNVKEEVEVNNCNLDGHEALIEALLTQARKSVAETRNKIELATATMSSKDQEISKNQECIAARNEERDKLKTDANALEAQMLVAAKNRKRTKGIAIASGVVTGVSLLAIPFTFGLSGVAAGIAGGAMAVNIDETLDYKKDVRRLEGSIAEAQGQISSLERTITKLREETASLSKDIRQFRQEISEKEREIASLEQQIGIKNSAAQQINTLQSHAMSTLRSAQEALSDLSSVKDALEDCKDMIKDRSLEVSVSVTSSERLSNGAGRSHQSQLALQNEHQKHLKLMNKVIGSLDTMQKAMPCLLTGDANLYITGAYFIDSCVTTSNVTASSRGDAFEVKSRVLLMIALGLLGCLAFLVVDLSITTTRLLASVLVALAGPAHFLSDALSITAAGSGLLTVSLVLFNILRHAI